MVNIEIQYFDDQEHYKSILCIKNVKDEVFKLKVRGNSGLYIIPYISYPPWHHFYICSKYKISYLLHWFTNIEYPVHTYDLPIYCSHIDIQPLYRQTQLLCPCPPTTLIQNIQPF